MSKPNSKTKKSSTAKGQIELPSKFIIETVGEVTSVTGDVKNPVLLSFEKTGLRVYQTTKEVAMLHTEKYPEGCAPSNPFKVLAYADGLKAALKGRPKVTISVSKNAYKVTAGANYEVEFNDSEIKASDIKVMSPPTSGISTDAVATVLHKILPSLSISGFLEVADLTAHIHWDKKRLVAAVADRYHGVYMEGPVDKKVFKEGNSISLPISLLKLVGEYGGILSVDENTIQAGTKDSFVSFQRIEESAVIGLEEIRSLMGWKTKFSTTVSVDEFSNALENTFAVLEEGESITLSENKKKIHVTLDNRFGKVNTSLTTADESGKWGDNLSVSPAILQDAFGCMPSAVTMNRVFNPQSKGNELLSFEFQKEGFTVNSVVSVIKG